MGAWANDPFGNDTACDWAYDLDKTSGHIYIDETLEKALAAGDDYLDASDAEEVVAAADTVARLRGRCYAKNSYTATVDAWVAKQRGEVPQDLIDRAVEAVDRVMREPSELLDLWVESGEEEDWKEQMAALRERLTAR